MDHFTISDLEMYSGIKAHTIRIWEQRYNALVPGRSEGNTRYYDNNQLRRLLNIVSMMNSEYKVKDLCSMSDTRLFELVNASLPKDLDHYGYFIAQLISAGLNFDELQFEKLFAGCLLRYGLKGTYLNVIYPLLERIGIMWAGNTLPPATEHFISNLLRQKLFTAIDSQAFTPQDAETWLLFLPENEFHELGLLMAHYMIRFYGKKSVYLGSNIPVPSLINALPSIKPDNLLLFLVHNQTVDETLEYLNNLNSCFTGKQIYLSANPTIIRPKPTPENIEWLESVEHLEQLLK